ncbi:poly(A) polymerase type 3-like [Toxorhynchites rutilus septentrionalis]|uniref:poly(A) polymerase type 3-like n=1 Tax=Toxorhynchites rutilus septentrionalis TaxID=329112 RepID=UPI00247AA89F|nr:poly(A) polymerase type 3-like [Toxorhynchites rutilus septentrionalis]
MAHRIPTIINGKASIVSIPSVTKPSRKTFGLTKPLNVALPTPADLQKSDELYETLRSRNSMENYAELSHRETVLAKIDALVEQWVHDLSISRGMASDQARNLGGRIYPFGSYRLGVHDKGSDMDLLCVVPRNIARTDFFSSFLHLLKTHPEATSCLAVQEAYVPVIKTKFDGLDIDLLFARLALARIPRDLNLREGMQLKNLDEQSVRSVNGYKINEELLDLVPNVETFQLALRAIKLWAKPNGVYSNILGYFGGVSCAILVARVCQLYPNAAAATIVNKFFLIYSNWNWPQPVLLNKPDDLKLGFPEWNSNPRAGQHLMPIITPVYPQQNSVYNVSQSTITIIREALMQGFKVTENIMVDKASWSDLFRGPSFFMKYQHFLVVMASSTNPSDQLMWCGLVQSRLRHLTLNLEYNRLVRLSQVHTKCYEEDEQNCAERMKDKEAGVMSDICTIWFVGLKFEKHLNIHPDLTEAIYDFTNGVYNNNIYRDGCQVEVRQIKQNQLAEYLDKQLLRKEFSRYSDDQSVSSSTGESSEISGKRSPNEELRGHTTKKQRTISGASR